MNHPARVLLFISVAVVLAAFFVLLALRPHEPAIGPEPTSSPELAR